MSYNNLMSKVRYWDNQIARWIMRHFYIIFFQVVLMIIFLFWFVNMFKVIDVSFQATPDKLLASIMATQSINTTIIVFLILLNSFWMLFIFNTLIGLKSILKDINFHISKLRFRNRKDQGFDS